MSYQSLNILFPDGIINDINEENILNELNKLSNIKFAFETEFEDHYYKLVEHFLIANSKVTDFENPGIILLMKSFISKLMLRPRQRLGEAIQLLNRMEDYPALCLLKISPPIILRSLFALLDKSPNHRVALKLLNQHPIAFVNMILQKRPEHQDFSLFHAVTNPIALRLLAKYIPTDEFLQEYANTDWSKYKILATASGDDHFKEIEDVKDQFFQIVSEPLIKAATLSGHLIDLCLNCPDELKCYIMPTIINLASMNPLPPQFSCLIPFISAISTRFAVSLLGEISNPIALLQALKFSISESPQLSDSLASLISKKPCTWEFLPDNFDELPELQISIQKYIPYMLQHETDACIHLLEKMSLTDKTAALAINQLSLYLPKSFDAILNCANSGLLSFRLAAGIATQDNNLWSQFAYKFKGRRELINQFFDIVTDFIICSKFLRALQLIDVLSLVYVDNDSYIRDVLCDFILDKFRSLPFNQISHQILFIKVFGRVHRFYASIEPILDQWILSQLNEKCLSLIIRFLWISTKDDGPEFLLFRLRLLHQKIGTPYEPKAWSDEILMMPNH